MYPGAIALTVMPTRPTSTARDRVNPITAVFAVAYPTRNGSPEEAKY